MTDVNIENLSVTELEALKSSIAGAIEQKRNSELLEVRAALDELVDSSPFTLEEILEAKQAKKPVAPKYKNPDDASQTWTGRGRKPRWVVAHLENGGTLEEIAI